MEKPKVIVLYNKLFHYRIPVWNILARKCDLTVAYSDGDGKIPERIGCDFKTMYLPVRRYFHKFVVQKAKIRKLVKEYDAVIAYGDIAWLKYSTLPWFSKTKVVFHSLGVSASYDKGYDSHHEWDGIRKFFYSKANALAFYTHFPIDKYEKMGIPREKMFEAPNTVEVHPVKDALEKDSILFVGTLYRQKGLQSVLDSYLELRDVENLPKFRIVGKGPDYEPIHQWIEDHKMGDIIEMMGAIYNIDEKTRIYLGLQTSVSRSLTIGAGASFSFYEGLPFFIVDTNHTFTYRDSTVRLFNTFTLTDDTTTAKVLNVHFDLNYKYADMLKLGCNVDYNLYLLSKNVLKPWYQPALTVQFNAQYILLKKFVFKLDFYVSAFAYQPDFTTGKAVGIKPIFDFDFGFEYLWSKRFSIFADLNNFPCQRNRVYYDYPNHRINALVGIKYCFGGESVKK